MSRVTSQAVSPLKAGVCVVPLTHVSPGVLSAEGVRNERPHVFALSRLHSPSLVAWIDLNVCEFYLICSSLEQLHTPQMCSEALWTLSLHSGQEVVLEMISSAAVMKERNYPSGSRAHLNVWLQEVRLERRGMKLHYLFPRMCGFLELACPLPHLFLQLPADQGPESLLKWKETCM